MDFREVHKTVEAIKSSIVNRSNSLSFGILKSHIKGQGLQFKEHQVYVPGDDLRFLDWKMLAKTSRPYLKTYEEERNSKLSILLDSDISMLSGFEGISKLQVGIEIAALLFLLAEKTSDEIELFLISDDISRLPLTKGEEGIVKMISLLYKKDLISKDGKTSKEIRSLDTNRDFSISKEIDKLMSKLSSQKREIVVLSSFCSDIDDHFVDNWGKGPNIHLFKIVGPLDYQMQLKYSFYALELKKMALKLFFKKQKLAGDQRFQSESKHFKIIDVSTKYLDDFICKF